MPKMIRMTIQAVTVSLLRDRGIHAGRWHLRVVYSETFGINAHMGGHTMPAVLVGIAELGLVRDDGPEFSPMSVDAAVENPVPPIQ
jgi:hypothetical protein